MDEQEKRQALVAQLAEQGIDPYRAGLGRLALSPAKLQDVLSALLAAPGAAKDAAVGLYNTIRHWETDPSVPSSRGDPDIGRDAFMLGPGMLTPGFARAAGGVTTSRVSPTRFARTDSPEFLSPSEFTAAARRGVVGPSERPGFERIPRDPVAGREGQLGHIDNGLNLGYSTDDIAAYQAHSWAMRNDPAYKRAVLDAHWDRSLRGWGPDWRQKLTPDVIQEMNAATAHHPPGSVNGTRMQQALERFDFSSPPKSPPLLSDRAIGAAHAEIAPDGLELGASGGRFSTPVSRILKQPEIQNIIRAHKDAGRTDAQIAEYLNELHRLEEGTISSRAVTGNRQRAEKRAADSAPTGGGDFELGAFGGTGSQPASVVTAEDIAQMARDLGYQNVKVSAPKRGDSRYVTGEPPGNPPRSVSDIPMVRVPADGHVGRPPSGREIGNRIDMGTPDSTTRTINIPEPGVYQNAAGEPFSNLEAVDGFLRWRRGDLVSPDAAPGLTRETDRSVRGSTNVPSLRATSASEAPVYPERAPAANGAAVSSDQLRLLSRGVPLPPPPAGPFLTDDDRAERNRQLARMLLLQGAQ